ncbi:hypothetical protein [Mucilaginibacter flavus]|uniref:hypothetical protein n=1 Tax=Mucilaginibacter flavus TaxID=931504 RepID=UPI0025B32222|nr:hypothetical protein [Mucilaginibacter flavus]MDN3583434.1 hypothetical protein [Mucilaginibacter flavus]
MSAITYTDLDLEIKETVSKLLEQPVDGEKFIASFTLNGPTSGSVHFQHRTSARQALACWEAHLEAGELYLSLKYNDRLVLFRSSAADFRNQLAQRYPIF